MTKRILPADVYDTLELSAHAYGGIGAGVFTSESFAEGEPVTVPWCVFGHAQRAENSLTCIIGPVSEALGRGVIGLLANDYAVRAINKRKGVSPREERVTFEEWCAELGVVRGE